MVDVNFPGLLVTGGFVTFSDHNVTTLPTPFSNGTPEGDASRVFTVPPGFVGSYCVHWEATNVIGDALFDIANTRIGYTLTTI